MRISVAVVSARAGTAQERNAALAAAGDADVIAFRDEDVEPPPGWLDRLRTAWAAAPDDRGAIGGPIALEFPDGRPAWLGDGLLPLLGPLDYGDEPLVVDVATRTLRGGNLSFRASALRGIGAFWPARGRAGQRDWFSEEHHAQRELAEAGWTVEYRPELAVRRRVAPRFVALLRNATAYGARAQAIGRPRPAPLAARTAAGSAVGSAVALARRDRARAGERAGRAAENAGALLGERLVRRELEPVATSTPFQASVPARPRRSRPRSRGGSIVLLYHRVTDDPDPLGIAVTPRHFAEQMDAVRDRIVPLREIMHAPPGSVAITFDDGYADNLPALRAAAVPATVFITTGHVANGSGFWWDEVGRLLATARTTRPLELGDRAWRSATDAARRHIHAWLQPQPPEQIELHLAQLRAWAGAPPAQRPRPLTVGELRELAQVAEIGAHTVTHPSLGWADAQTQQDEIDRSAAQLESWLGTRPRSFAYPFGVPGHDFDTTTKRIVAASGFIHGMANTGGQVTRTTDPLAVPRFYARDICGAAFAEWLSSQST